MLKQRSRFESKRASATRNGALLATLAAAALLAAPTADASPQRGADDGVFSFLGIEFCLGDQAAVDCDVTIPVAEAETEPPEPPPPVRKVRVLGLTMCVGGVADDCDVELPMKES